jgi:hypothetical protein
MQRVVVATSYDQSPHVSHDVLLAHDLHMLMAENADRALLAEDSILVCHTMSQGAVELGPYTESLDFLCLLLAGNEALQVEFLVAQAIEPLGELADFGHAGGGRDIEWSLTGAGFL